MMKVSITYLYTILQYGYLGLDLGASPALAEDLRSSLRYIREIAGRQGIPVES